MYCVVFAAYLVLIRLPTAVPAAHYASPFQKEDNVTSLNDGQWRLGASACAPHPGTRFTLHNLCCKRATLQLAPSHASAIARDALLTRYMISL